ncbi:hypothetical protein GCM10010129_44080 [Streptomyces fumigatiscleroticus]|nr:hypothetical protein GCM10010129_44080 [Streptomyces fumigatiscleroticus]
MRPSWLEPSSWTPCPRRPPHGRPTDAYPGHDAHLVGREPVAHQALTAAAALRGYTTAAAHAVGETATAGRMAVGTRADVTAFVVDPLRADPDEPADAPMALTVVDGHITHRRDGRRPGLFEGEHHSRPCGRPVPVHAGTGRPRRTDQPAASREPLPVSARLLTRRSAG